MQTPNFRASKEVAGNTVLLGYFFAVSMLGAKMAATNLVKAENKKGGKWAGNRDKAIKSYPDFNLVLERVEPCGGYYYL